MRFLAKLFAPSEHALEARQKALETEFSEYRAQFTRELLELSRLKRDLSNQLKSLGAYEARARRKNELQEEEDSEGLGEANGSISLEEYRRLAQQ